jgi:hypothetical protein
MSTPNQQIGWGQTEKLLATISKQLDRLIKVTAAGNTTTTTTTTV